LKNIAERIQLEETLTEFIEEAKTTHQRSEAPQTQTRANHGHGYGHSFIIDTESNIDDKKNNTMRPLPHVPRNRTAIQGPEPLEK